ncbi:ABC transporter substrate-binding protein [Pseudomonas citronellolis]|uniref:ABC transporter substrate-binding protein n=1 Tax=Pseudomonas citronellolis TaxID=53408 RepID=A0AAW6PBP7_9PSED|nr:ABC transporter substrate-binding protein [Pseudomonas citronellolis]MDF3844129.1 ABC transporter substrate-binding protein [Pseudomonas citronellolis]
MKKSFSGRLNSVAIAVGVVLGGPAMASDLTVISFGGAGQKAQVKAFYEPWEQSGRGKVIAGEYNGEMAKLKAMVDTKSVSWDLLEVESPELARGCDEGLFEELDPSLFGNPNDYVAGSITPCGISFFVASYILAYNADKLKQAPTSWADFWDVRKFPGKRGLRRGAKHNLEYALMADGVPIAQVYQVLATKAGQDRAFRKLDELKPYIQWWEAGAQPLQYMMSGDVVMSSAYSGRVAAARSSTGLRIVWNEGLYDSDSWAIPKGSPNLEAAKAFAVFSSRPQQQKAYAEEIFYGPTSKQATALLDPALRDLMPTAHLDVQVPLNVEFWVDNGEQLEQRFSAWAAK